MTLLNADQQAEIKHHRQPLWTRPFTVIPRVVAVPPASGSYYSTPYSGGIPFVLSGDWVWQDQSERRGSPGGVYATAHLILNVDILHSGSMMIGARVVVDGIECGITALSPYPESGELVMAAVKVRE